MGHKIQAIEHNMKRMIEFADKNNLEIVLVCYPPYYSKYNPIDRCWGILGNHWNATLLDTMETTMKWAKTMTWKGISPVIVSGGERTRKTGGQRRRNKIEYSGQ